MMTSAEATSLTLLHDHDCDPAAEALDTVATLTGRDRDDARLALIARAIACEHQRGLSLAKTHDELLCCRDLEALEVVARLMTASNRRLCSLLAEHRACTQVGQRAAIIVGHAGRVDISAGK
jgi:hypothetical protein